MIYCAIPGRAKPAIAKHADDAEMGSDCKMSSLSVYPAMEKRLIIY
jgi:hypothetical protein